MVVKRLVATRMFFADLGHSTTMEDGDKIEKGGYFIRRRRWQATTTRWIEEEG